MVHMRRVMGYWYAILLGLLTVPLPAAAGSYDLAPGFESMPAGARILVMPTDVELFSMSAGGVLEPKADWTQAAQANIQAALKKRSGELKLAIQELSESDADDLAEIGSLHAAVARSIELHHIIGGRLKLPTKNGLLDWSLGDAVKPLSDRSGTDYALFVWMRDSYASAERKVAMVAMALFGVGISAGAQVGYASLVDLRTGQIIWFNRLMRGKGDLRDAQAAEESVDSLLYGFPAPL